MKKIEFAPPDITEAEIAAVTETLRSGWITTGPRVKKFEVQIADYCSQERAVCLSSATAGLELALRLFEVGPGDEVVTTPYTYAATANVILHTGAKPVFADVKDDFNVDPEAVARVLSPRTKAVISVDFGGMPVDYDELKTVLDEFRGWSPSAGTLQETLPRPLLLADTAHGFGAEYDGRKLGSIADMTVFSFHAVKNLTTAEGGAVTFGGPFCGMESDEIYKQLRLLSLHGQSKDALAKMKAGAWRYTIELAGYKCNMTDIQAAIGMVQLSRYDAEILPHRKAICETYLEGLAGDPRFVLPSFVTARKRSSYHLFPLRLSAGNEKARDVLIDKMADAGIACNVHYIPLPLHPLYRGLGYRMEDYPKAAALYRSEVSLPVHSKMTTDDAKYVCGKLKEIGE